MKITTKLWKNLYAGLGQINPDCPLENNTVKGTMTTLRRYRRYSKRVIEGLGIQYSILEIGCGFGGLAQEILKEVGAFITVVDNKIMLAQAKKYLGDKVEYIDARKIKTLQNRRFGLFISHHCLSETPLEYREYILKNIIKNCQRISIIDINDGLKPTRRMIRDGYEIVPLEIEKWVRKYFMIEKIAMMKNQSMYIGERLK